MATLTVLHVAVHNISSYIICICSWCFTLCLFVFQYAYSVLKDEYPAMINVRRKNHFLIDSADNLNGDCFVLFWCFFSNVSDGKTQ